MPRYRPGDHVVVQLHRYEMIKLTIRTGMLPAFEVCACYLQAMMASIRIKCNVRPNLTPGS